MGRQISGKVGGGERAGVVVALYFVIGSLANHPHERNWESYWQGPIFIETARLMQTAYGSGFQLPDKTEKVGGSPMFDEQSPAHFHDIG